MNKYHAVKCEYDGHKFDSKHERDRYIELSLLQRAGKIKDLQLQVPFVVQDSFKLDGKTIRDIRYIADFVYTENGKIIIEDAKGKRTQVYELKKKLFMYKYRKYIREV